MQALHSIEQEIRTAAEHRPVSVKAVIFSLDNKILLLKRPNEGRWDMPGGGVDEGETLSEALIREIEEEVGLTVDNALPLYSFIRDIKPKPEKLIQFVLCRLKANVRDVEVILSDEHDHYHFFDHSELDALSLMPSYLKALHIACEMQSKEA